MLAIGIDDENELAVGIADTGLDCGAVPLVVGMRDHARTRGCGCPRRVIRRAVVDDEDLFPGRRGQERPDDGPHGRSFLECRDDYGYGRWIGHDVRNPIIRSLPRQTTTFSGAKL